jgi:hypothetical protein
MISRCRLYCSWPFIVVTQGLRLEYTGLPALRVSGNAAAVASVFPFAPAVL